MHARLLDEAKNKEPGLEKKMEYSNGFPRKRDVSLQELSKRLDEFAKVKGWDQYHSPRNLLLALVSKKYTYMSYLPKLMILKFL